MNKSAVIAIVDPLTFSLDHSVAWTLTSALQAKQDVTLVRDSSNQGALVGITPMLQPVRITISGHSGFLMFMRALLDVAPTFDDSAGTSYSLASADDDLARMSSCQIVKDYTTPFLIISPKLSGLVDGDIAELSRYVAYLTTTLWDQEPIGLTTHRLLLASNGQLMTSHEMTASGLVTGIVVFASGQQANVTAGSKPVAVSYQNWSAAGAVTARAAVVASCSSDDASSAGGTGDGGGLGGDGSLGDGGDGDGDGDGGDGDGS